MKYYRVTLFGQVTGSPYTYSVGLDDKVPPLAAKEKALALHGEELSEGKAAETVYPQGARIRRAPRCWSLRIRGWRVVRCSQDDVHVYNTKWHFSPGGYIWKVRHEYD